jgi:hypothetical protein
MERHEQAREEHCLHNRFNLNRHSDLHFRYSTIMSETPKVGRPALPKKEKRWKFISTRISQDEYQEIVQAAKESGMPKTKWVRTKLVAAARRS